MTPGAAANYKPQTLSFLRDGERDQIGMEPTKEQMLEINKGCAIIPGDDGWSKESGGDAFAEAVVEMVKGKLTVSRAIGIAEKLYWAAASEFGA